MSPEWTSLVELLFRWPKSHLRWIRVLLGAMWGLSSVIRTPWLAEAITEGPEQLRWGNNLSTRDIEHHKCLLNACLMCVWRKNVKFSWAQTWRFQCHHLAPFPGPPLTSNLDWAHLWGQVHRCKPPAGTSASSPLRDSFLLSAASWNLQHGFQNSL